jgi:hypothetical protein
MLAVTVTGRTASRIRKFVQVLPIGFGVKTTITRDVRIVILAQIHTITKVLVEPFHNVRPMVMGLLPGLGLIYVLMTVVEEVVMMMVGVKAGLWIS